MLIPAFNSEGLLPPGVHGCTVFELRSTLGLTPRRQELVENLVRLLKLIPGRPAIEYLLVDGNFTEETDRPTGIALGIVVVDLVRGGDSATVGRWLAGKARNLQRFWGLDAVVLDQAMVDEYWMEHYTHTPAAKEKGVLRLDVNGELIA